MKEDANFLSPEETDRGASSLPDDILFIAREGSENLLKEKQDRAP